MTTDVLTPQGCRLASIPGVRVAEENHLTVLGSIPSISVVFEVACNDWNILPRRVLLHAQVPVSYLGLWSGKRTLAEFQLGQWFKVPTDPEVQHWLAKIATAMQNIQPMVRVSPVVQEHQHRQIYLATRGAVTSISRTSPL